MLWLFTGRFKVELTLKEDELLKDLSGKKTVETISTERGKEIYNRKGVSIVAGDCEKTNLGGINLISAEFCMIYEYQEWKLRLIAASERLIHDIDIRNYKENKGSTDAISKVLRQLKLGAVIQAKTLNEIVYNLNQSISTSMGIERVEFPWGQERGEDQDRAAN